MWFDKCITQLIACASLLVDLTPFVDTDTDSPMTDLVHPSVDILEQFSASSQPRFHIVSNEQYLAELSRNSSLKTAALLPPQFLVSLSYKPADNTVLRLISVQLDTDSAPQVSASSALGNNNAASTSTPVGSVVLSSAINLIRSDGYLELWDNLSHSVHQTVDLLVANGHLSVCVGGELQPAVRFWPSNYTQSLELLFSPHLHSATSVVSRIM